MTNAAEGRPARAIDILAICLVSSSAAQTFLLMPVLLGTLADGEGYGPATLGNIAAATAIGGLLMGLSSPMWLPRARLRQTSLAFVLVSIAGLALMAFTAHSPAMAMLCMGLHGIATGTLYTLMFGAVSLYAKPEKTLGWKLGTEALPGLALLYIISNFVVPHSGTFGVLAAMALSAGLLGAAAFLLPAVKPDVVEEADASEDTGIPPGLVLAVSATFAQWMGVSAVWTFMERIGVDHGLSLATIGTVLTLGWFFASIGSLGAGALGNRFGLNKPFLISSALTIAALLLFLSPGGASYAVAANVFLVAASFAIVYAVAKITSLNTQPRFAGAGAVALQAAGVVGPIVGGQLYAFSGASAIVAFVALCTAGGAACYLAAHRRTHAAAAAIKAGS